MPVVYSLPALRKALVGRGGAVQFVTDGAPQHALDIFRSAANRVEVPMVATAMDGADFLATSAYATAPGGPVGYMHHCDNAELLASWLASVSDDLAAAGLSGRLQQVVSVSPPVLDAPAVSLGAALVLEYDDLIRGPFESGNAPAGWWVSDERTRRVLPALVSWCLDTPGDVFVRAGAGLQLPAEVVTEFVLSAVGAATRVTVERVATDQSVRRRLVLHSDGGVVCTVRDETATVSQHMELLQAPLRHCAVDAVHAFVRAGAPRVKLGDFWETPPKTPFVEVRGGRSPIRLWSLAHLQPDYVPDAYVQQVPTSSQLDRIDAAGGLDPARWHVEELDDRRLVTAKDTSPWLDLDQRPYARGDRWVDRPSVPDLATLARAREDFGPALLTAEVVAGHPPPTGV